MSEVSEQRQVLDMLKDGRIEAEDAERLLACLAEAAGDEVAAAHATPRAVASRDRHLIVCARTEDGDQIDARIPLKLIATGINFEKLMPEAAREAVEETGVDLSELRNVRGDQLIEAIQDLEVDLEGHDGQSISIRCE